VRIVVLDTGPFGLVTNPKASVSNDACRRWLRALLDASVAIVIPEIADYEVRRELLRGRKLGGIARLDQIRHDPGFTYLPISTEAMRLAASLWAEARRIGRPTADPHALDCDVILAAQAKTYAPDADDLTVATTNIGHHSLFLQAERWQDIPIVS
jgi:hypothetical protein